MGCRKIVGQVRLSCELRRLLQFWMLQNPEIFSEDLLGASTTGASQEESHASNNTCAMTADSEHH
eukprot:6486171-Amphidinium_carterae.1